MSRLDGFRNARVELMFRRVDPQGRSKTAFPRAESIRLEIAAD